MSQKTNTKDMEKLLNSPIFGKPELMLLAHAKMQIKDEENWVRGTLHKTGEAGQDMYCIQGALQRVMEEDISFTPPIRRKAEALLRAACEQLSYQGFNDTHTHEEVMSVMNMAIAIVVNKCFFM